MGPTPNGTAHQVSPAEALTDDEEAHQHLNYAIENSGSRIELFDQLPLERKSSILKLRDSFGRNAYLKTIYCGNVVLLEKLLPLLDLLQLQHLIILENDHYNHNAIHLALLSDNAVVFYKVWGYLEANTSRYLVSDQILQRNHSENSALALALHMREEGTKLINEYMLPILEVSYENVSSLILGNAIVTSIKTDNFDIACKLVREVEKHSGGNKYQNLKRLFIDQKHHDDNFDENLQHDNQPQYEEKSLLEILMDRITPSNRKDLNMIVNIFFSSAAADINDLYGLLVAPHFIGGKQVLSILIDNDCHQLISSLLRNQSLAKKIWDQMNNQETNCPFSRHVLESHAMSARMVAAFNQSRSNFYLNLTNQTKAKTVCLLFYTGPHTASHIGQHRHGAKEECYMLKNAMTDTGVSCEEMPHNGAIWNWQQLKDWLVQRVEFFKDDMSHLVVAGFCHGSDGLLHDADMAPCALRDIIKIANSNVYKGIPITFIFQGCRQPIGVGSTPTLELERDNLVIMTCSEGQLSRRGVYTKWFAQMLRKGIRDILHIHADVANEIKNDMDIRVRQITPELRSELTKRELSFPRAPNNVIRE